MTEEARNDSRLADLARAETASRNYRRAEDKNTVSENSADGRPLSDDEEKAVKLLAQLGFEYKPHDNDYLTFERALDSGSRLSSSSRRWIPRVYARMLLRQLGDRVEEHPAVTGMMVPSRGYAELVCSRFEPAIAKRAFQLDCPEPSCAHKDQAYALPSVAYRWPEEEGGESVKRIHLSGTDGEPCVEISNASPLAMLLYGHVFESTRVRLAPRSIPFLATLKVAHSSVCDRDQLAQKSEDKARSLIYELNVRNDFLVELDAPPARPEMVVASRPPEVSDRVRYPRTKVQREVSILFGFASQAGDDPPRAFLSYYQALEYFIPTAIRQSAIKSIRRELRDPSFDDADDASLLRIVKAAEGSIAAAEPNQLRIVVNEYVRASRLKEFFEHGWGDYFSGRGPIRGVAPINVRNTNLPLPDQVADRVYQIRNRIVHAKDDPRYGAVRRVLLPHSTESNALTPDVLLVRLLATEAISVG